MDVIGTACTRMVFHSLDGCLRIVCRWFDRLACCNRNQQEEEEEEATKTQAIANPTNTV